MNDAIWFWLAKPLAELLMTVILIGGIAAVMTGCVALKSLQDRLNAWIDKKRRNES